MLIVSRAINIRAGVTEAVELALRLREVASSASGLDIGLYGAAFGYPTGTFVYSTMVGTMAEWATATQALMASSEYQEATAGAVAAIPAPGEDRLRSVVSMPEGADIPVGAMVVSVTAEAQNGKLAEAVAFGVELADYYHRGTEIPSAFVRNLSGSMSEVQWLAVTTADGLDKAFEFEATDVGYHERFAAAGDLFIAGSGHRGFATRLG